MNLILLGAPGSGKGTQAVKIAAEYKIPHISTGDIFRKNISEKTPIGVKAKGYIDEGKLVPDEVTIEIVRLRLLEPDVKDGCLLDGFPRNTAQAEALDKFIKIDKAVNLDVDLDKLMKRLAGRRVCKACGESYHISVFEGKACVKCRGEIIQRADDNEDTVNKRLVEYRKQTEPLIDYYKKQGKLISVDGMKAIEDVFTDIKKALK